MINLVSTFFLIFLTSFEFWSLDTEFYRRNGAVWAMAEIEIIVGFRFKSLNETKLNK